MFGNAFKQLSPLLQDLFEVYLIFFQPHWTHSLLLGTICNPKNSKFHFGKHAKVENKYWKYCLIAAIH